MNASRPSELCGLGMVTTCKYIYLLLALSYQLQTAHSPRQIDSSQYGTGLPNPSRETKFSGANGDREKYIFPVQLTTSIRIGNLTRLNLTLVCMVTHKARVWINRARLPILHVVSSTGKISFPCPRSRLRIWSRVTSSTVPSRVSLLIPYSG